MRPATEERLFSSGCLGVLAALGLLLYLASQVHWGFSVAAAALLAAWLWLCQIRSARERKRNVAAFQRAFSPGAGAVPEFKAESHYGFPSFTLTFTSEAEMKRAEAAGGIAAFKQSLQEFYGHLGGRQNPFDPARAVWATYKGWQPQFISPPEPNPPSPPTPGN